VVACSFASIAWDCCETMGPASILETVKSTETPTGLSPDSRDRWTGLEPLHRGRREGWMLSVPNLGVLFLCIGFYVYVMSAVVEIIEC